MNGQLRLKELKFEDRTAAISCSSLGDVGKASFDPTSGRINFCHKFPSAAASPLQDVAYYNEIGFLKNPVTMELSSTNSITATEQIFISVRKFCLYIFFTNLPTISLKGFKYKFTIL